MVPPPAAPPRLPSQPPRRRINAAVWVAVVTLAVVFCGCGSLAVLGIVGRASLSPEEQARLEKAERQGAAEVDERDKRAAAVRDQAVKDQDERLDAWMAAKEAVKGRLRAPATAKFSWLPPPDHQGTLHFGPHHWGFVSQVDSQNGFGALLRSKWSIEMKRFGYEGDWQVSRLTIEPMR